MGKKIVNKSVSFNVLDPDQMLMKEFVEQYPNFSGYMKRLIQRDMERKQSNKVVSNRELMLVNGQLVQKP